MKLLKLSGLTEKSSAFSERCDRYNVFPLDGVSSPTKEKGKSNSTSPRQTGNNTAFCQLESQGLCLIEHHTVLIEEQ